MHPIDPAEGIPWDERHNKMKLIGHGRTVRTRACDQGIMSLTGKTTIDQNVEESPGAFLTNPSAKNRD
jgi:hypothetical protein